MSKFNMVDLDGNNLGSLDSSSNTVKNSSGKTLYTIKGKYLISEADDEVLTVENDGRVADESGKQVGYIYNYKDFKESRSTSKSTTKTTSSTTSRSTYSSSTSNTKSSTTTSKPKPTPTTNNPTTKKDSWTDWLWLGVIVLVLIWLFGPKSIEGTWSIYEFKYDGVTYKINEKDLKKFIQKEAAEEGYDYDEDEMDEAVKEGLKMYKGFHFNFNKDGTGSINAMGKTLSFKWHKKKGNTYVIEYEGNAFEPGASGEIEVKGNKIVFDEDFYGESFETGGIESLTFKKD